MCTFFLRVEFLLARDGQQNRKYVRNVVRICSNGTEESRQWERM